MDFVGSLMEMQSGKVVEKINVHWLDLIRAIHANGGKGKITLQFEIKATGTNGMGQTSQVEISESVKVSKPERSSGKAFFFLTGEANLSRKDQRQMELEEVAE